MYRCISDRYDHSASHYDSLDDFLAMCRACFGEAPQLTLDGESYRDDQGIVLEPAPEMRERFLLDERAAAEVAEPETPPGRSKVRWYDRAWVRRP